MRKDHTGLSRTDGHTFEPPAPSSLNIRCLTMERICRKKSVSRVGRSLCRTSGSDDRAGTVGSTGHAGAADSTRIREAPVSSEAGYPAEQPDQWHNVKQLVRTGSVARLGREEDQTTASGIILPAVPGDSRTNSFRTRRSTSPSSITNQPCREQTAPRTSNCTSPLLLRGWRSKSSHRRRCAT